MSAHASLFRSLAALHRAGVPWPQALASATGDRPGFEHAQAALASGASLSEALGPLVDPLDRAVIRAGEETGGLDAALDRMAARHDADGRERGSRRAALLYPVLLAHIAALLLPLPDLVAGRGAAGLVWSAAVLLPVYLLLYFSRPRRLGTATRGHPGVRMPKARGLLRSAVEEADARGLTALADCTDAGVPLNEALPLVVDAGAGGRVAWDLYRGIPRVRDGAALGTCWQALPAELGGDLAVAEEAGELGAGARRLASRLTFDVDIRRKKVAAVLPLALLLLAGAVIAWRVISFYTQAYSNIPRY